MLSFVLLAFLAQPGDAPPSKGSIQAAVQKRDKLPLTFPPGTAEVVLKDGAIHLTRQVLVYVTVSKEFTVQVTQLVPYAQTIEVKVGDRLEKREITKYKPVLREEKRVATFYDPIAKSEKQTIAVKSIKAFVVNKDGKLDALAAAKLLDLIAKPTRVLVGEDADLDPRHVELIRAGAIYLALPKTTVPGNAPPESRKEQREEIPPPDGGSRVDLKNPNDAATIEVTLSSDVPLFIDGIATSLTGTRRVFTTPPLPRGKTFTYEFRAYWPSGRSDPIRVSVGAGQSTKVEISEPK